MHFLTFFALQDTLIMLNTLHKVEDHENHVRWIYLTTVFYIGESQKYVKIPYKDFCPGKLMLLIQKSVLKKVYWTGVNLVID